MKEEKDSGLANSGFTNLNDVPNTNTDPERNKPNTLELKQRSKSRLTIAAVLVILVLLAIALGVGLYFGLNKDDDNDDEKTEKEFIEREYTYHQQLSDKVNLKWDITEKEITFEIEAKTDGWVGFGVSNNGNMYPADLIMAWETDDGWEFKDRHTTAKRTPSIDDVQNWTLLNAKKESGIITLRFKRDLETCDDEDIPIKEGTTRVIFAVGDVKNGQPQQHARDSRWAQSMFLLDPPFYDKYEPEDDSEFIYFDLINKNYTIPHNADTTYYCTVHKLPEYDTKHHIVEVLPVIQEGNEPYVHHIVVTYCPMNLLTSSDIETYDGQNYDCYEGASPAVFRGCFSILSAWAVGGKTQFFPKDVGFPIGRDTDPKLVILETHYDNPDFNQGVVDSSGLRLKITTKPRPFDAGVFFIGSSVHSGIVVPPKEPAFLHQGYCPQECLAEALQDEEVTVSSIMVHTHLIGSAVRVRLIRNGTEIEPLLVDETYDFNFQEMRPIPNGYVIKSGDQIVVDCVYKTENRNVVSYGGYSTEEEMCFAFLVYYPAKPMTVCLTKLTYDVPDNYENLREYTESIDWTKQTNHEDFKRQTLESDVTVSCLGDNGPLKSHGKRLKRVDVNPVEPLPPKPSECPRN